jgi:hypothetical protein
MPVITNFYLNSERITDVLEHNRDLDRHYLETCVRRKECLMYLKKIYSRPSDKPLTMSDYENLYNIYYLLHTGSTYNLNEKIEQAQRFIEGVKLRPNVILSYFSTVDNN